MATTLRKVYKELSDEIRDLFVVPLIPFHLPKTSYLSLLYSQFIDDSEVNVHSISVFAHWRLIVAPIFLNKPILHYHWLEFQDIRALIGMPYKLLCISLFKALGGKLVWTLHNWQPHDEKYLGLHQSLSKWMARTSDKVIVHCASVLEKAANTLSIPKAKIEVVPHPEFPVEEMSKAESIDLLSNAMSIEISHNDYTFLVFGQISHYKQIPAIIEAFTSLKHPKAKLIIAGVVKKGNADEFQRIKAISESHSNIHVIHDFVNEINTAALHLASDCAVANHKDIISSGSLEMAYSYDLKIIASNAGCIEERKSNRVLLFDGQDGLIQSMKLALKEADS